MGISIYEITRQEDSSQGFLLSFKSLKQQNTVHFANHLISFQELNSWFSNEFLQNNKKLEAVRQFSFDDSADGIAVLNISESAERWLLASLCYEFGRGVATRFFLSGVVIDDVSKNLLRKAAKQLLWSVLENLHPFSALELQYSSRTVTLKYGCFYMISTAIGKTCKRASGIRAKSSPSPSWSHY